jgi:hypothetical protein
MNFVLAAALAAVSLGATAQNVSRSTVTNTGAAPASQSFQPNATLTEDFATVSSAAPTGSTCPLTMPAFLGSNWFARNNSVAGGTTCVFQGNTTVFNAQAGAATSYAGMNFNATTGANTISVWFVTPRVQFGAGQSLEFWVRKGAVTTDFPDRLQVLTSVAADTGTPDVGTLPTDVGTFTNLVLDINPTLQTGNQACVGGIENPAGGTIARFPRDWCRVRLTAGLPAGGTGRIAFRYFVTQGGPTGANSDFIGIDTLSFVEGSATPPAITLTKRVQLANASTNCTGTGLGTSVTLPFGGGTVDYCYVVTNTGGTPLVTHTLTDPAFSAPILSNFAFNLGLGASAFVRQPLTVTRTTSTPATWTACNQATNCTGAVTASATVPAGVAVAGVADVAVNTLNNWGLGLMLLAIGAAGFVAVRRYA